MLDDKEPRTKLGPPSRGSSFYIENLLGSTCRGALTEEREETPRFGTRSPVTCDGSEVPDWSGTSPNATFCAPRSEWLGFCVRL